MNEKYSIYTAGLQPDNRDIRITGGLITEVQLYTDNKKKFCDIVDLNFKNILYHVMG